PARRGDPQPRARQAAARRDHPPARRRRQQSLWRPPLHGRRVAGRHRGRLGRGIRIPLARGAAGVKRWMWWGLGLVGAGLALGIILVMARFQVWARLVPRLPAGLRLWASQLAEMGGGGRLVTPTILGMANWVAQWAAYQFTLQAMHIPARPAASFTAMIAVNLGGIVRMTPANIGVMQAA